MGCAGEDTSRERLTQPAPARQGALPSVLAQASTTNAGLTGHGPLALALRLYPALQVAPFRTLWLGMLPSTLAWQMSVVATGYAALTFTGSATMLGLVSSAIGVPMLVLSLIGGVVADRFARRTVLLMTQSILCLSAACLVVLVETGLLQVWHLVALGLAQGTAFSFNMPARQAYIADLVGRTHLRNAVALNNAGVNFCRVAGPALAGGLLALPTVGVGGVFAVMTAMYIAVLVSLLRLPHRPVTADATATRTTGGWAQLVEGLAYLRASPVLLSLLGVAFATLFFGMPYQQLMPVFSEHIFAVGAAGLGTLMAASGVGSLAGSLAAAALAGSRRPATLQLLAGVAFGLALIGFALAPAFLLAVALLIVVGFMSSAYTTINSTLIMSNTDPRLYGRVMSIYLLTFAVMPIAALPMAWLADHVGGRLTITLAGILVVAVVAGVALLYPTYRRIR